MLMKYTRRLSKISGLFLNHSNLLKIWWNEYFYSHSLGYPMSILTGPQVQQWIKCCGVYLVIGHTSLYCFAGESGVGITNQDAYLDFRLKNFLFCLDDPPVTDCCDQAHMSRGLPRSKSRKIRSLGTRLLRGSPAITQFVKYKSKYTNIYRSKQTHMLLWPRSQAQVQSFQDND